MTSVDDDYIYDEVTGEWRPASEIGAEAAAKNEVRDASGNVLADGDAVVLIKDLKVKGAGQTLKQGTVIARSASPTIRKRSTAGMTRSRAWCCGPNSFASDRYRRRQPAALAFAQTSGRHSAMSFSI